MDHSEIARMIGSHMRKTHRRPVWPRAVVGGGWCEIQRLRCCVDEGCEGRCDEVCEGGRRSDVRREVVMDVRMAAWRNMLIYTSIHISSHTSLSTSSHTSLHTSLYTSIHNHQCAQGRRRRRRRRRWVGLGRWEENNHTRRGCPSVRCVGGRSTETSATRSAPSRRRTLLMRVVANGIEKRKVSP
jgi:hypothetical protein